MQKLLIAVVLSCALLFAPACGTVNKSAYKTTQVTSATADLGLKVWADWVARQKMAGTPVPLEQEVQAKSAWNKFQDTRDTVIKAGIAYTHARESGAETSGPSAELTAAVAAMAASSADFISLLQSFGVKVN